MRPSLSCIADAQEYTIRPLSDAKQRRNNPFIACQRRYDYVAFSDSSNNEVAIELPTDFVVQDKFLSEAMHARLLLRVHRVEKRQGFINVRDNAKCRPRNAIEDPPAPRQLHCLDRSAIEIEAMPDPDEIPVHRP